MTLTHNAATDWADSSNDSPRHHGLTEFGRQVIGEMNRLGMLVDVSHVSDSTFHDVLEDLQSARDRVPFLLPRAVRLRRAIWMTP